MSTDTSLDDGSVTTEPATRGLARPATTEPEPSPEPRPSKKRASRRRDRGPIVVTTAICAVFAAAGHGMLWLAYSNEWNSREDVDVPWQPVAGISIVVVAVVAFGGFYVASRRARVAIAASFLLTFLVTLTYAISLEDLAGATRGDARELIDDFRYIVTLIVGFYFGTEAAVSIAKIRQVSTTDATTSDVQSADRDLEE